MMIKTYLYQTGVILCLLQMCFCFQSKTLTYKFSELSKSTIQVKNQEGEAGVFTFDFLSDMTTHPKIIDQGVHFTQGGEYLDIDGPLFEYEDFCSIETWVFIRKLNSATFVNMNITQIVAGSSPVIQRAKFVFLLSKF
ncbi:unnamed protein product [Moneuplotes crassus]|uniref:Uncharacterized protein n=1 Tax=Euplotes crassus TaxID=5936 RepID=A0AAD1Y8N9_EUPCR|nr:unnamed protein product [Moneuplotes crassus]